jgi:hypothetical protein
VGPRAPGIDETSGRKPGGPGSAGGGKRSAARIEASEAVGAAPDTVRAIEMAAHDDARSCARRAPGLFGELQGDALEADDIVVTDDALVLLAQDAVEIDGADRHKGGSGIGGCAREASVVVGNEMLGEIGVGCLGGVDPGVTQFVHEAILQGAVETFAAAAGLWGVRANVLDAERLKRAAELRGLGPIDGAAGLSPDYA